MTEDIDVVYDLQEDAIQRLLQSLGSSERAIGILRPGTLFPMQRSYVRFG